MQTIFKSGPLGTSDSGGDVSPLTGFPVLSANGSTPTSDQLDLFLISLNTARMSNGTLDLTGVDPCGPAGMAALTVLLGRGYTVTRAWAIITQQPKFIVNGDGTWKLTIVTNGSGTTYQWQSTAGSPYGGGSWSDVMGETGATFNNPPMALPGNADQAYYRCVVTRNAVAVGSQPMTVDVPDFNGNQPSGGDTGSTNPIVMSVAFSPGDPAGGLLGALAYAPLATNWQWFYRASGSDPWTALDNDVGRTEATGQLSANTDEIDFSYTAAPAGDYKVVLTAPNGAKVESDVATWT